MDDMREAIARAIRDKIPDAAVTVEGGGGGHFSIQVISPVFEGKGIVDRQRLVYGAIAHLMAGDRAPVHAIDRLTTKTP